MYTAPFYDSPYKTIKIYHNKIIHLHFIHNSVIIVYYHVFIAGSEEFPAETTMSI